MLRREIKLGQGMVGWCYLDRLVRECLSHKSAFEQGPESSDGAGHVDIWRKIIPAQRDRLKKTELEVGLRKSKGASVAGTGGPREEWWVVGPES